MATICIINTNVQPNTVIGGGNTYPMSAANTQFEINGVQYTIALRQGSLSGATISGQFNITQGNVVVIENYVYVLDTLNGQIVGNGTAYPLTTSGVTYTISTATAASPSRPSPTPATVTIGNVVYQINSTTVVGDEVTYPIVEVPRVRRRDNDVPHRPDGIAGAHPVRAVRLAALRRRDLHRRRATYTVNDIAAFDGTTLLSA